MVEVELASLNKLMELAEHELKRREEMQHGRPEHKIPTTDA